MTEPKRFEAEAPETEISDGEDFAWPLPVSSADIVWLEPNPRSLTDDEVQAPPARPQTQDFNASSLSRQVIQEPRAPAAATRPPVHDHSTADIVWLEPNPRPQTDDEVQGLPARPQTQDLTASSLSRQLIQEWAAPAATTRPPVYDQGALPLSRLLSPQVVCEWHDAVAVVQQVAEQIMHGLLDEPKGSIPDIHRIGIEPGGQLRVRLDTRGLEPLARGLGHLLYRLLANRDSPAAVRLIVSQAMSDLPTIRSVGALVRELSRWERPYRAQKLSDLYERALNAPDISHSVSAMIALDPLAEPAPVVFPMNNYESLPSGLVTWSQGVMQSLWALRVSRPLVAISAAAAVCVALAMVAAIVALRSRPSVAATPRPSALVEEPASATPSPSASLERPPADVASPPVAPPTAPPAVQGTNPVAHQATAGIVMPRNTAAAPRTAPPVTEPAPATSVRDRRAPVAPTVAAAAPTVAAAAPGASAAAPTVTVAAPSVTVAAPTVTAAAPTTSFDPKTPDPVGRLYTTNDPGIVAPVLIRPYLPELADPSTPNLRMGALEVVIGTTGLVESVRLRSPENRYRERWWLFVAKNWQFRPAYKDGQPVRYLKVIPLTDVRLSDPQ
jgi:hypothetical protein